MHHLPEQVIKLHHPFFAASKVLNAIYTPCHSTLEVRTWSEGTICLSIYSVHSESEPWSEGSVTVLSGTFLFAPLKSSFEWLFRRQPSYWSHKVDTWTNSTIPPHILRIWLCLPHDHQAPRIQPPSHVTLATCPIRKLSGVGHVTPGHLLRKEPFGPSS